MIFAIALAAGLAQTAAPDTVILVREHVASKKHPLYLYVHNLLTDGGAMLANEKASDFKFHPATGKKPLRFSFTADWDGDQHDEIVAVRERADQADHRLELFVYREPKTSGGNTGKALASSFKSQIGVAAGEDRVVAMGPIDVDGDGVDEVAEVRESPTGEQSLYLLDLPQKPKGKIAPPFAFDLAFGHADTDATVSLFGIDVDGDGKEELVALRRGSGADRLLVFEPPSSIYGDAGLPIASDLDVAAGDGAINLSASRMRLGSSGPHGVLFLRQDGSGAERLEGYELPAGLGGDIGSALVQQASLAVPGFELPVVAAHVARHGSKPLEQWEYFVGAWEMRYRVQFQDLQGTIIEQTVGPFPGFTGTVSGENFLTIRFPNGTTEPAFGDTMQAAFSTELGSLLQFHVPDNPLPATLIYYASQDSQIVTAGDTIVVTYPVGVVDYVGDDPVLRGAGPPGTTIGEVLAPNGDLHAVIVEFELTKK